jgi:hypothetical protein
MLIAEGLEDEQGNAPFSPLKAARLADDLRGQTREASARASAAPSDAEVELLNRVARYFAAGRDAGELARRLYAICYRGE